MFNQNQSTLEAATVYLYPQHQIILEEARLRLRRQGLKVNKSQLVRIAINLLSEQESEQIIQKLHLEQGE